MYHIRTDMFAAFMHNKFHLSCNYMLNVSAVEAILRLLNTLFKSQNKIRTRFKIIIIIILLLLLLLLLTTAVQLSLSGSSPYTSTDKTNKNKYT
jgi:nitrogen fixation/metabolism regulation signal transduction histidine kinase